jgi:hypothetical protein
MARYYIGLDKFILCECKIQQSINLHAFECHAVVHSSCCRFQPACLSSLLYHWGDGFVAIRQREDQVCGNIYVSFVSTPLRWWDPPHRRQNSRPRFSMLLSASFLATASAVTAIHGLALLRGGMTTCASRSALSHTLPGSGLHHTPQRKHVGNARLSPIPFDQRQKLKLQGV